MKYKRTKNDSPLYCPYCGKQFSMDYSRYRMQSLARRDGETKFLTSCYNCGKTFYMRNVSAKYARDNNIQATFKLEESPLE